MNNNQLSFSLRHTLPWEITRPVCDMAAFFDYKPSERGKALLTLTQTASGVTAVLEEAGRRVTKDAVWSAAAGGLTSGEAARCVKLAVLQAFGELTGRQPQLPWGILTGVRPGKLAHKLLDEGVSAAALPKFLKRQYLLPEAQGSLLRDIAVRQKALLPDAAYAKLMRYERYGMILLLVLVATGVLGKPLTTVTEAAFDKLFVFAEWGYELIGIFG